MAFNSWTFVTFFVVVLALHHLPLPWTVKKVNLMLASYVFYAAWNPPFVLLLWFTSLVDWIVARQLALTQEPRARKAWVAVSVVANLGLLSYFKYGNFLLENFVALANTLGFSYHPAPASFILPMGISFYTFVTLSYTIDVYRGTLQPAASFVDYCLLVTFFPHLVAGPILRAEAFLPQCVEPKLATSRQLGWGLTLMVFGLFEKVVLADAILAPVADRVYGAVAQAGTTAAWLGTLSFAGQIFSDFDGYSLCAIGAALCLGFVFPDNFRFPYAAVGFSDFWRRWHISLSSWLRDYLYVSLGGNRGSSARTYFNLLATMLLGGLWHGASWSFVVWGGLHGTYLVVERYLRSLPGLVRLHLPEIVPALVTFVFTCIAWVFFRVHTTVDGFHMVASMLTPQRGTLELTRFEISCVLVTVGGLLAAHWSLRHSSWEAVVARRPWWVTGSLVAVLLIAISLTPGDHRAFIYFQF